MSISQPLPNFDRAEYHNDPPRPDECAYCHHATGSEYFRIDGNMACPACARQAQDLTPPDSHKAYSRAVLFGVGGAIAACVGYALVQMMGFMIGFVAIGVGWVIGKAMMMGSRGLGGRRYQITAAVLTYIAISMAFIPALFKAVNEYRKQHPSAVTQSAASPGTAPASKPAKLGVGGFLLGLLVVFGLGIVSPFIKFAFFGIGSGLFGLLFLFIGIQAAWKLTMRVAATVEGPFEQTAPTLSATS